MSLLPLSSTHLPACLLQHPRKVEGTGDARKPPCRCKPTKPERTAQPPLLWLQPSPMPAHRHTLEAQVSAGSQVPCFLDPPAQLLGASWVLSTPLRCFETPHQPDGSELATFPSSHPSEGRHWPGPDPIRLMTLASGLGRLGSPTEPHSPPQVGHSRAVLSILPY